MFKKNQNGLLKIGEVAEKTGLPISTIRYYTDIGLLSYNGRTQGGYRLYEESVVIPRINTIKKMNSSKPTLQQISQKLNSS